MTEDELMQAIKAKRETIGTKALAAALGVSEVTVRSVTTGNYPGEIKNIIQKYAKTYIDVVECPYAKKNIARTDCQIRAHGPKPFGGQSKLAWWQACQSCEHK